jgi:hypothetical protein
MKHSSKRIEAKHPQKRTERALWFALLGPAVAWAAAHLVSVSSIGRVCRAQQFAPWQWAIVMSIVGAAMLVTIGAAVVAFRTFNRRAGDASLYEPERRERVEFLAKFGFIGGLILLTNIVLFAFAPLIIQSCMGNSG